MVIGIVSDTHGLLRNEALTAMRGVDYILHAGDVGDPEILVRLRALAPVTAIRGNIDTHGICAELPTTEAVELAGVWFYLLHSVHDLDIDPVAGGFHVVVTGHSHKASITQRDGVLYLNPGSIGPRRFHLPVTLALVQIEDAKPTASVITLMQ